MSSPLGIELNGPRCPLKSDLSNTVTFSGVKSEEIESPFA